MENKINVVAILKDKPQGVKLYDLLRNIVVELDKVHITDVGSYIECTATNEVGSTLMFNYSKLGTEVSWLDGLQILLPSKIMRDWSKFTWKKGDVLQKNSRTHVIFDSFVSDTYEVIRCKYFLKVDNGKEIFVTETNVFTNEYFKASEEQRQCYINKIEEHFGGKLNLETLEIEKSQLEFKDGDIVCMMDRFDNYRFIFIYRNEDDENFYYHAHITRNGFVNLGENEYLSKPRNYSVHFATDLEKQQLFDALAKKGKAWDGEKKMIVGLKPKFDELKPFDKVVVRCSEADRWSIDFFSYKVPNGYICTGDAWFGYCLPYNEETAKLIGTTKDMEV